MKNTTRFAAVIAAASLALGACSSTPHSDKGSGNDGGKSDDAQQAQFDYAETDYDDVKDGGTLTTAIPELSEQANPFHQDSTKYSSDLWEWYNPQMALFSAEGEWSFNPEYFDDVVEEEVDGNTVVTYKIKEEATYNDGTPIDYKAFEATWKANSGSDEAYKPNSTDGYAQIKSVEPGESDKEAVVTFDGIYAWWQGLFNFVMHPSMVDPQVYNEGFIQQAHPEWGAGPYKLESIDFQKGEAVFVPNEKWWGRPGKLEKRVFKQMESQASLNAFKNGETDATGVANEERMTAVSDMSGIEIRRGLRPTTNLIMINSDAQNLSDIKVRQAIFESIDRSTLAGIAFQGIDYTETPPGSFLLYPFQEDYRDAFSEAATFDPEHAKELLEEAGWTDSDGDGIREKDGKKLEINYPITGDSKVIKDEASALQSMMKTVGVDLKIQERPVSEFSDIMTQKEFDMFALGFTSTDPFGVAYFDQIYGSDSGLNRSGTGTEEFDKKIAEVKEIPDRHEQTEKALEYEVEAFKLYGIMPTMMGPDIVAVKEGLVNLGAYGFAKLPVETIGWAK